MRRAIAMAACLLVLALAVPTGAAAPGGQAGLSRHDRELLAAAAVRGEQEVTLIIATAPGANPTVERGLARLGGKVRFQDETLGYIRARVPLKQAEAASRLPGIEAVDLDEILPMVLPVPEAALGTMAVDPPGASTGAENPYMPTRDIGAPQFVAANPTYDGRGVTIGILDTGIDLLTPELQSATTLDGQKVPKIIDWVTFTDPLDDNDPTWLVMEQEHKVGADRMLAVDGSTYKVPSPGSYRFGIFDERDPRLAGEVDHDVDRDGNPAARSGLYPVLWHLKSGRVWVDLNQNSDFSDEPAMRDYKVNYDMGVFGTDDPATPERDTMPFVVQTDAKNQAVNIGIISDAHGTHVAGIAAGQDFFGGTFDGAAPEAQVVSVRVCLFGTGCTAHALIEGMIYAAKTAKVDVINMSIGGLPALNDGNNSRAILYDRLIDRYGVQIFISAGNSGPGINTVGDPSVASNVMSVGAYVHADTWYYNYGSEAAKVDGLFTFSSRGPREDGGFKPNIVAPGAAISSIPGWQQGSPVPGTFALPPGYGMFNGTSMAAPQAAGGAALLISAAKQNGLPHRPDLLRHALSASARFLDRYAAHEQGTGLMDVATAWDILQQRPKLAKFESRAPVNTIISGYLAEPHTGPGIYEREGWAPGMFGTRTITFTRTNGGSRSATYDISWTGNDGTFSSASTIELRRGRSADLAVTINPTGPGIHSAILNLDDPMTPGIDYRIMNTVVAAEQFTVENNFAVTVSGEADRPDKSSFFFYVPPDTPAFQVDLTGITGRIRMLRQHPYGIPYDNPNTTGYMNPGSASRTATNPTAGVWEVTVETSRVSPATPATFELRASIMGVDMSPAAWVVENAAVGQSYTESFSFTNRFGAFTGGAEGTALGSAFADRPTISADGGQQVYWIEIPAGTEGVSARIGSPSDSSADLDLFLFDCSTGSCALRSSSTSGSSEEFVAAANPAPGMWAVLVDPYAVPSGATEYDYLDVYVNPAFGSVSVADSPAMRGHGASWSAGASAQADAHPGAGRFLQGFVQMKSGASVLGGVEVRLVNMGE